MRQITREETTTTMNTTTSSTAASDEEDVSTEAHDDDTTQDISATDTDESQKKQPPNPFTSGAICLADLADTPPPETNYLVERLAIAPGRPTLLYGPSGIGKTVVVSHLATCVALNRPLFGRYDVRPALVHLIDMELGETEMSIRLRQQVFGLGARLEDAPALTFRSFPRMRLDDEGARDALMRAAEGVGLIVIDNLARATRCSENDARGVSDALALLAEVSIRTSAVILVVAHSGKRMSQGMRGSSTIRDASQCVLCVTSPGPGRIVVEQTKAVPVAVPPVYLKLEDVGEVVSGRARGLRLVEYDPDETPAEKPRKPDARQTIVAVLEAHPDGMAGRELRRAVGGNTKAYSDSLRVLVAQNIVVARPDPSDGRRTIYQLARHAEGFVPQEGRVIQFPGRRDDDDDDDAEPTDD